MSGFFVTGGTLKPDAPSYIERAADEQLYSAVLRGEYCNVLTTRQMGKSSLMARTAGRLRQAGIACATVDLQGKGDASSSPEQWYYGVAKQIASGLELAFDWSTWWKQQVLLLPAQRMTDFFGDVVLKQIPDRVVVFIDEVDWMIRLKFSDEFFAAIRSCFNRRATEPAFDRLTFVLLGSAAPAQLIRDATRTPFNIGRDIELTDFTPAEAKTLVSALGNDGEAALERILYWTDGHPYLTQMLCSKVVEKERGDASPDAWVDCVVQDKLLSTAGREENNLKFVADRLTQATGDLRGVLKVYRDVLRSKPVKDVPASSIHTSLRLTGVVKPDAERRLRVRNLVYRQVFNHGWVRQRMPSNRFAWGAVALGGVIAIVLVWYISIFPEPYVEQLETASSDVPAGAYLALHRPFPRARADDLFAQFWERRGDRDQAILVRARSGDRKDLAGLLGADYPLLIHTFRSDGPVAAVAYSPDGKLIATGSFDGTARVFEAATGREVSRLTLKGRVVAVAFSPDGKLVATGSYDNTARVFEAATGREVSRLPYLSGVSSVAFSPDSKLVAAGSYDNTARVFEAATGRELSRLSHQDYVRSVAFSPDGKLVATGSSDKTARVFEAATGREVWRLAHQSSVSAVTFSPDGKRVASGSDDDTARVFEAATGREVSRLTHKSGVYAVAFSPDGGLVATGSFDYTARVFDATTGGQVSWLAHQDNVRAVAFSPDGKLVATGSDDKTARVFEAATGREVSRLAHQRGVYAVAFSPDGKQVASGSDDKTTQVFEAATGREVSRLAQQSGVSAVTFSEDRKLVATGSEDKTARVFEAATGREISHLDHQRGVFAVTFSPDGERVATGSLDYTARVFEAATGRELARLIHEDNVYTVAFSPDGRLVATGSVDTTARVFEAATGREVCLFRHQSGVYAVVFSPNGKLVATGSNDKTARVFEAATAREVSRLAHQSAVYAVAFSPDGKLVATGSLDKTARVFEAATGREVARLAHQDLVDTVAFSPDGKLLVTKVGSWLHLYQSDRDRWRPVSNRHVPVIWAGGTIRFTRPQDHCARCVDIVRDVPENMLKIDRINFDEYSERPLADDPSRLAAEWGAKLGLGLFTKGGG